jgi:lipoprotein-anchoring transpeptidase ErfK/SrfK
MPELSRRAFLAGAPSFGAALALGGCVATPPPAEPMPAQATLFMPGPADNLANPDYALMYAAVPGDRFPIPAVDLSRIDPAFLRAEVYFPTPEPPGTIVIDPHAHYLYYILGGGRAIRYGVGVGRQGFSWSGIATINSKQEWPDWYPPKEMLDRQPELAAKMSTLQSGIGMHGGPGNPLGARAMYLWQNGKDTLYRIHGTVEPWTIGTSVSSGCIRMINQDAMDLYNRTPIGTQVMVLGSAIG